MARNTNLCTSSSREELLVSDLWEKSRVLRYKLNVSSKSKERIFTFLDKRLQLCSYLRINHHYPIPAIKPTGLIGTSFLTNFAMPSLYHKKTPLPVISYKVLSKILSKPFKWKSWLSVAGPFIRCHAEETTKQKGDDDYSKTLDINMRITFQWKYKIHQ